VNTTTEYKEEGQAKIKHLLYREVKGEEIRANRRKTQRKRKVSVKGTQVCKRENLEVRDKAKLGKDEVKQS
jgi:hypothetical protein